MSMVTKSLWGSEYVKVSKLPHATHMTFERKIMYAWPLEQFVPFYRALLQKKLPWLHTDIVEFQREIGPLAVDLDFRYKSGDVARFTEDDISDFVNKLTTTIHKVFDVTNSYQIHVFTKQSVYMEPYSRVHKDGVHLVVELNMSIENKKMLRGHVLESMEDCFSTLELEPTNTMDSILDKAVFNASNGMMMYGSTKKGQPGYDYSCSFNIDESKVMTRTMVDPVADCVAFLLQNVDHETPSVNSMFKISSSSSSSTSLGKKRGHDDLSFNIPGLPSMDNMEELQVAVDGILSSLGSHEYRLKDAYDLVMALPASYYSDYTKWMQVGWALKNTCKTRMFPVWMMFSSQWASFKYTDIPEHYDRWIRESASDSKLTYRSIVYWAKEENPARYKEIRSGSLDYAVEQTCRNVCTEFDIANIVYRYYTDNYVCVSIRSNAWYHFHNHRWIETDSGTALRRQLTNPDSVYGLFNNYRLRVSHMVTSSRDDLERDYNMKLEKKVDKILLMLKTRANLIMVESAHLFYEQDFLNKLDSKNKILCFTNGVFDFDMNVHRAGRPDDLTNKCTNIEYIEYEDLDPIIVAEINTFMGQLFPNPDLLAYMWEHAASVLIGLNTNQTFNIYTGEGRNGKSKFVELMSAVLGDYKGIVPVALITTERVGIGAVAPEIAMLKGVRLAVMQESSLKDRINEGIMKELTGGDMLQSRGLYKDPISFIPQFKLVMSTNNLPAIDGKDDGTWRRIRTVEFTTKFEVDASKVDVAKHCFKADPHLDQKFEKWKTVFMSMLVRIAKQTQGIVNDRPCVTEPSEKYRLNQDYFASFMLDCITICPTGIVKDRNLNARFKEWWKVAFNKNAPMGKELFDYMRKHFKNNAAVLRNKTAWIGISIITEDDEPESAAAGNS
jgi:P4 family phage/plasmid primase-like protien